jgi:hypothetical protein
MGRCLRTARKLAYSTVTGTQTRSDFFRCAEARVARFQSRGIVSFDLSIGLRTRHSVFVGTSGPRGATLLHIDLAGKAQAIWQQSQPLNTWGIPSPDGRHIAIFGTSAEADVWMIDNP